jgi:Fibronectin type III domain
MAKPELAPPPTNVNVKSTPDGFTVTWDPPTGPHTDSIIEYNVLYWDSTPEHCAYISSAAFTCSPATVTGLERGVSYVIALTTWNKNGQGLPVSGNNVMPGAGRLGVPTDLIVTSSDATSAQ